MNHSHDPKTILRENGLKATPNRLMILKIIRENGYALSSDDIVKSAEEIDKVTVYRTLKSFETIGLIHQVPTDDGVARYAPCTNGCAHDHAHDLHAHFQCVSCGQVTCMDEELALPKVPTNFEVQQAQLLMKGLCPTCH